MQYDLVFYLDQNSNQYIVIKDFKDDSTLKGILDFCHSFDNYNDLMFFIYTMGYINEPNYNGVFKIHSRASKNSKPKVFAKGLTFAQEKHFFQLSYLEDYYVANMHSPEFIQPIIKTYFNYILGRARDEDKRYLCDIRDRLNTFYESGNIYIEPGQLDLPTTMRRFVRDFSQRNDGKGHLVTYYQNLIILARHAINFERMKNGYNPNIPCDEPIIQDYNQAIQTEINHYKTLLSKLSPEAEEYLYYINKIEELECRLNMTLH